MTWGEYTKGLDRALCDVNYDLSTCAKVDGLVRERRRCQRYEVRDLRRTRVPLKVVGGTFVVAVEINETITLDFVLDSGAADVSVPSDVANVLIRKNALKKSDFIGKQIYMLADGSSSPSDTFIIRSLRIGDKQVQNVRGSISPATSEPLLGQAFLQHFRSWSIDNSNRELLLEYA
jgi:clan AA aspartic protease (TIGR02281 family)